MDMESTTMHELDKNIKENGRMTYGMERELIQLVFHLK